MRRRRRTRTSPTASLVCGFTGVSTSVLGLNASGALRQGACSKEFREIYLTQYQLFNPVQFNADEWAALCSRAGMKYIITTTKHHDGFCLWPTKTTTRAHKRVSTHDHIRPQEVEINYSVMDTPFKRDAIAELATAFRKKGLGFGIHFSHPDWNDYRFRWDFNNRFYDPQYPGKPIRKIGRVGSNSIANRFSSWPATMAR